MQLEDQDFMRLAKFVTDTLATLESDWGKQVHILRLYQEGRELCSRMIEIKKESDAA